MKKPISQERANAGSLPNSMRDRLPGSGSTVSGSLPAAEIEALLRMARDNIRDQASGPEVEELGPGDVQYLRGHSMRNSNLGNDVERGSGWPANSPDPDSLLREAERHLAEAIFDSPSDAGAGVLNNTAAVPELGAAASRSMSRQGLTLEDLGDLDLDISIELGRTEILIEDVLKLREGSVVTLDKLAGDPVDIVANGRLVARGELLVIDGKFGVRLSEVL